MCDSMGKDRRFVVAEMIFRNGLGSKVVSDSTVKFDVPVNISEVKILSPRMYLKSSNGGFILGNTSPSQMVLQLFCNNVHRRDASLIDLGTINYEENRRSTFRCQTTIWATTLTVRGQFLSLAIGVYGLPQVIYTEFLQKRDRSSNLPNLNFPCGMSDVAYDYYSYLESSPETVLRKFEPYIDDSEDSSQSDIEFDVYGDDSNLS